MIYTICLIIYDLCDPCCHGCVQWLSGVWFFDVFIGTFWILTTVGLKSLITVYLLCYSDNTVVFNEYT